MRLRGRQGRFLTVAIGGWIAARAWLLWPAAPLAIAGAQDAASIAARQPGGRHLAAPPSSTAGAAVLPGKTRHVSRPVAVAPVAPREAEARPPARLVAAAPSMTASARTVAVPPAAPRSFAAPRVAPASSSRAVEAQAYLFVRPGSGRAALAPGGSLGGGQAAARVAVALNPAGPVRTAAAARVYAPLHGAGAEAALGLDWHPLARVPLRLSVERRIGLDAAGRNAWSAYAAGGFYAGRLPFALEADGYAQAGVVGLARRDLFADGAVRVGRRIALGAGTAVVGAGGWGAAQPGAERLDVGPRASLSWPVERHRLTLALEGRLRIAGGAAPGSGAALTLAADF